MPKIIYDYRERTSGIIKELIKHGIEIEEKALNSADFIIPIKDINGNIVEVGIERKTIMDFLNSIIDKRILNQLIILKENFSIPLLIIEGEENIYQIRNFHPNSIRGILASIAVDYQIPILQTRNPRDTASLLVIISNRLEKSRKSISLLDKRKPVTIKEQQKYIVESLPGVGPTIAKSLLKKFGSVKEVINASEDKLKEVDKIGKKKSENIRNVIDKNYNDS